jgi:hypothetical protein
MLRRADLLILFIVLLSWKWVSKQEKEIKEKKRI